VFAEGAARQVASTILAHYQEGTAAKWIRDDLNAVMRPYLRHNS
jgi:hypothetical protein